jgi:hypothetical protein
MACGPLADRETIACDWPEKHTLERHRPCGATSGSLNTSPPLDEQRWGVSGRPGQSPDGSQVADLLKCSTARPAFSDS